MEWLQTASTAGNQSFELRVISVRRALNQWESRPMPLARGSQLPLLGFPGRAKRGHRTEGTTMLTTVSLSAITGAVPACNLGIRANRAADVGGTAGWCAAETADRSKLPALSTKLPNTVHEGGHKYLGRDPNARDPLSDHERRDHAQRKQLLKHDALRLNQSTSQIHRHCERSEAIQGPQHWALD